ncbi:ERC protein 2-like isoform X2 [Babylonia areolata]|uniref:ERC protein 2-like isoform X2 n=1 Tax=Babylonia areolata TaxID=304850 RepID=UPI003FD69F93
MPEFKLKKMFGKSQSSSKSPKHSPSHRVDTASGESGGRNERSHSPRMTASPEHHVPCVQSSGYGSRSSLSGSSFSGGGSKSNSLERQSHTGSDGGISSMSGSGTDDSGHSSMSSPLNLPMEQLQSFNAMYRAGQYQSTPNPYQLNVQGPPKNLSKHQMHHHTPTQSRHNISRSSRSLSTTTAPEQFFDGAGLDISFGSDEVFRSDHSPDRSSCRKQSSPSSRRDSPSSQRRDSPSSRRDSPSSRRDSPSSRRRDTKSRYVNLCYPILDKGSLYAEASETNSVPEPRSVDHGEEMNPQALHAYESDPSQEDYRNKIIFELQWQVSELHERCAQLQKEADLARDRLGSSMHSVTTFWSPELKKERSLRKDEASRCNRLYEQLVVRQAELKQHHEVLKSTEKDGACRHPARDADSAGGDVRNLVEEKRAQEKERGMLQQRSDELEKHLEMQNQTLSARDASIKTLLDMLQDKREDDSGGEQSEQEVLQVQAAINANRIWELEATLQAKDTHLKRLKELKDSHASQSQALDHRQSTAASHPLSAMVEAKDSQILSLEKEVAVLEEKLLRSQEDVILGSYRELCTEDSVGMKGKHLHHEIQKVREELSRRERKLSSSQRHAESLQCQQQESLHHLAALKEQLADREQQAATLQTAVAGLQERIKNKDGTIERKRKENQALISDKQSLEAELAELKDQLDSREHNINVLKRKAEMYDDVLKEKDEQLYRARSRQACVPTIDSPVFSPEDAIAERDRQIERLRQLQSQSDRDHQEELELYIMTSQDLKTQMAAMRFELTAKQTELRELREEAGKLRGQKAQRETKMMQLELAAQDRTPPPVNREDACTQTDAVTPGPEMWSSTDESLSGGLEWSTELPAQGPSLLEELQKKVSDMEEEKKEKEHQMEDMQDIIKEYREKVGTLKRNQQKEKEKNAQLLEAAKKREDSFTDDASHLSTAIEQKQSRIGELEEALRESVRITAQREMDMMELQTQIEASKTAMEEMRQEVEDMRASSRDYTSKLATLSRQLDDKDAKIRRLAAHQHCHIQELYEIKQEAVQAAIGEKEASIAVLEMSGAKKPRQLEQIQYLKLEKHRLEATLKDVTQSLAKLREGRKRGSGSTSDCTAAGTEVKGADKAGKKNYKDGSTTI